MKKLLVILLLFVYGSSSFGMTLYFHYCCDRLQEVAFSQPKVDDCMDDMQHEITDVPCCDDKEVVLKIKDVQSPAKVFYLVDAGAIIYSRQPAIAESWVDPKNDINPAYFIPPPLEKNLNHLYCIYRI